MKQKCDTCGEVVLDDYNVMIAHIEGHDENEYSKIVNRIWSHFEPVD